MTFPLVPLLSDLDPAESAEGGIDPLGLYTIADALAVRLVPGVRERQSHPRFLTAMAVSHAVCDNFIDELATDGKTEPWLVFEWYLVEGMVRKADKAEIVGLPGSFKARQSIEDGVPLSSRRYLKTPSVFGFHGIYRQLARNCGIESGDRLGEAGFELLSRWAKEQGLEGFAGTAGGSGATAQTQLREAVQDGLETGGTKRSPQWSGWDFFPRHLAIRAIGKQEGACITGLLKGNAAGHRREVLEFLTDSAARKAWSDAPAERPFHQLLRGSASDPLRVLLDAIECYERFARACQDAFDECLYEMTRARGGKVSTKRLSSLKPVASASQRVRELFQEVSVRLQPLGETPRFHESFSSLAEREDPEDWTRLLLEHHRRTQTQKPPDGKNAWFETWDDGSFSIRPLYLREESARGDDSYVHAYRTNPLWSFARDLRLVNR
jgi:hypothetical protein